MICSVGANRVTREREDSHDSIKRCARVASRAVVILAGWDERKKQKGKRHFYPSLLAGKT
jgi:uridine phosphorylase